MKKWDLDLDWLATEYFENKRSLRSIAATIGCSPKTIELFLKRNSLVLRTNIAAQRLNRNGAMILCSNKCGTEFYRKKYILDKSSTFFCSWKCEKEYQSKTRRKSKFTDGWGSYGEYRRWRKKVLFRDERCKLCGSSVKLAAHHILEAQNYPEKVYDINNGVTLCQSCHIKIHKLDSKNFIKSLQEAILVE